jgi:hybrid cluster-associated redox disulfide protein
MSLDEIMRLWPATMRAFIRNGMLCIGCPFVVFHTVADACDAHCIDRRRFEGELLEAMRGESGDARADALSSPSDRPGTILRD